jgi:hypothetical protein
VGDGMAGRQRGQRAAQMRWARYDRTKLPPSAAKDPTQKAAAKQERRAARNRPKQGESFADWFYANPDRIFLDEPYEELRSLPRGCKGCESPVEKPGEWCGACLSGRVVRIRS